MSSNLPTRVPTPQARSNARETLLRAAEAYDDINTQIISLQQQLNEATIALEGRNQRILVLEQAMLAEREQYAQDCMRRDQEVARYRAEADAAIGERNELRIVLSNFQAQLNAVEIPSKPPLQATDEDAGYDEDNVELGLARLANGGRAPHAN